MKKIFTLIVMLAATLGIQAQDTWTVAGVSALCGDDTAWNAEATINDMTTADGGTTFTLVKQNCKLKAGTAYTYKFVKNHADWYGNDETDPTDNAPNYELKVEENGMYTVVFTFNTTTLLGSAEATKTGDAEFAADVWTLVGATALFGVSWVPEVEDGEGGKKQDWDAVSMNDMTSEDGVTYTLTKTGLVLEAGVSYQYKVAQNHSWDVAYGKDGGGDNNELIVTETATYTVVFTFVNDETHLLTAVATKTGEAVIAEKTWTIAGAQAVLGSNWNNEDTANDMIGEGGDFMLVKENVTLQADVEYEFKVLANHSWDENYGLGGEAGGKNCFFTVDEDGVYNVTFVWSIESKELYAIAERVDPETAVKSVKTFSTANAVLYNLQGQRVKANFRGIAILNGKKVIKK